MASDLRRVACCLLAALAVTPASAGRPPAGAPVDCLAAERAAFSVWPLLLPAGKGGREGAPYCLANLRAPAVEVRNGAGGFRTPDQAVVSRGAFKVATDRVGNYHWLQATEVSPLGVVTASTAHYFANPGPAPTAMLQLPKADFEIVPHPLPREHWQYRAGETWKFLVRFQGRPLANLGLRLETGGGTQQVLRSDAEGVVRVTFPNDVAPAAAEGGHDHGRGGRTPFVLAAGYTDPAGRYYLTGFNHVYGAAPEAGRSLPLGLGFLALGGVAALPLVIRRKENGHG